MHLPILGNLPIIGDFPLSGFDLRIALLSQQMWTDITRSTEGVNNSAVCKGPTYTWDFLKDCSHYALQ